MFWVLVGCVFIVGWRPLQDQEPLPEQAEFIEICSHDDYQTLGRLLDQHPQNAIQTWLNTPVSGNDYPIHACAKSGCTDVLRLLLDHQADPNQARPGDGATPLYMATCSGHLATVQLLLDYQADPNQVYTSYGVTPIHAAAFSGHQGAVQLLLANGADSNQACTSDGITPIHAAAFSGHQGTVQLLLDHQADPNQAKNTGATPLYVAVQNGHQATVQLLLANGADPNQAKNTGVTPLYLAAQNGFQAITQLLLDYQADPNQAGDTGVTPLYMAAQNRHHVVVQLLLANGADPNQARISDSATPLHIAARNGHTMVVATLLKVGPISPMDFNANTPLHDAVRSNHPVVVVLLLQAGVDPSLQNASGLTALSVLNRRARPFTLCQQVIAELLQEKNRHWFVRWLQRWHRHKNSYGERTLLHEAIRLGSAVPIASHPDLETPRLDGCTPLHLAVLHGNKAAVAELVIQGVNLSPLDLQNETPLQLALQGGHEPIINMLGPAVITMGDGASMDSSEVSQGHSVDEGSLSELSVFSLQNWAASALRRWFSLDEIRVLFESGVLPARLSVWILGAWCRPLRKSGSKELS